MYEELSIAMRQIIPKLSDLKQQRPFISSWFLWVSNSDRIQRRQMVFAPPRRGSQLEGLKTGVGAGELESPGGLVDPGGSASKVSHSHSRQAGAGCLAVGRRPQFPLTGDSPQVA